MLTPCCDVRGINPTCVHRKQSTAPRLSTPHDLSGTVITPGVTTTQARASLDSASSTSFITEHLARHLWLPHKNRCVQIPSIGCVLHDPSSHMGSFGVSGLHHKKDGCPHQLWVVEAVVLLKTAAPLPTYQVLFNTR